MKTTLKLGLDYHNVITANQDLFARLTRLFKENGHEVHILTGRRITDDFKNKLKEIGIEYTHLFSISDHHYSNGEAITGYFDDCPEMDKQKWDITKSIYCKEHGIDLHIDDSEEYGKYFETPYLRYTHGK